MSEHTVFLIVFKGKGDNLQFNFDKLLFLYIKLINCTFKTIKNTYYSYGNNGNDLSLSTFHDQQINQSQENDSPLSLSDKLELDQRALFIKRILENPTGLELFKAVVKSGDEKHGKLMLDEYGIDAFREIEALVAQEECESTSRNESSNQTTQTAQVITLESVKQQYPDLSSQALDFSLGTDHGYLSATQWSDNTTITVNFGNTADTFPILNKKANKGSSKTTEPTIPEKDQHPEEIITIDSLEKTGASNQAYAMVLDVLAYKQENPDTQLIDLIGIFGYKLKTIGDAQELTDIDIHNICLVFGYGTDQASFEADYENVLNNIEAEVSKITDELSLHASGAVTSYSQLRSNNTAHELAFIEVFPQLRSAVIEFKQLKNHENKYVSDTAKNIMKDMIAGIGFKDNRSFKDTYNKVSRMSPENLEKYSNLIKSRILEKRKVLIQKLEDPKELAAHKQILQLPLTDKNQEQIEESTGFSMAQLAEILEMKSHERLKLVATKSATNRKNTSKLLVGKHDTPQTTEEVEPEKSVARDEQITDMGPGPMENITINADKEPEAEERNSYSIKGTLYTNEQKYPGVHFGYEIDYDERYGAEVFLTSDYDEHNVFSSLSKNFRVGDEASIPESTIEKLIQEYIKKYPLPEITETDTDIGPVFIDEAHYEETTPENDNTLVALEGTIYTDEKKYPGARFSYCVEYCESQRKNEIVIRSDYSDYVIFIDTKKKVSDSPWVKSWNLSRYIGKYVAKYGLPSDNKTVRSVADKPVEGDPDFDGAKKYGVDTLTTMLGKKEITLKQVPNSRNGEEALVVTIHGERFSAFTTTHSSLKGMRNTPYLVIRSLDNRSNESEPIAFDGKASSVNDTIYRAYDSLDLGNPVLSAIPDNTYEITGNKTVQARYPRGSNSDCHNSNLMFFKNITFQGERFNIFYNKDFSDSSSPEGNIVIGDDNGNIIGSKNVYKKKNKLRGYQDFTPEQINSSIHDIFDIGTNGKSRTSKSMLIGEEKVVFTLESLPTYNRRRKWGIKQVREIYITTDYGTRLVGTTHHRDINKIKEGKLKRLARKVEY